MKLDDGRMLSLLKICCRSNTNLIIVDKHSRNSQWFQRNPGRHCDLVARHTNIKVEIVVFCDEDKEAGFVSPATDHDVTRGASSR